MHVKSNPIYSTRTETSDYFDYEKQEVLHVYKHNMNVVTIACDDKGVIDIYLKMIHNAKNFLSVLETVKRLANSNKNILLFTYQ
ncbi:MAG: hypothetical protein L0F91_05770 [Lactococcus lactis]|nr:hypothetical protein [Lactococcus lactis]